MTVELAEAPCPSCGADLQVIYATELAQVVSGLACTVCGFFASERASGTIPRPDPDEGEYVLLRTEALPADGGDARAEFRARAAADLDDGEVWLLLDGDEVVDVRAAGDIGAE